MITIQTMTLLSSSLSISTSSHLFCSNSLASCLWCRRFLASFFASASCSSSIRTSSWMSFGSARMGDAEGPQYPPRSIGSWQGYGCVQPRSLMLADMTELTNSYVGPADSIPLLWAHHRPSDALEALLLASCHPRSTSGSTGYASSDVDETAHVDLLPSLGICWPATHLTLSIVGGVRRPVVAWAIIGTSTMISRSVQIWVTSNIIWINDKAAAAAAASEEEREERRDITGVFFNRVASMIGGDDSTWTDGSPMVGTSQAYRRRERRWNWKKVGLRCLLPTGFVYVVMAWAEFARREWETQYGGGSPHR
jgi:N-glycosylation protein